MGQIQKFLSYRLLLFKLIVLGCSCF